MRQPDIKVRMKWTRKQVKATVRPSTMMKNPYRLVGYIKNLNTTRKKNPWWLFEISIQTKHLSLKKHPNSLYFIMCMVLGQIIMVVNYFH